MPIADLGVVSLAYGLNHYTVDRPYRVLLRAFLGEEPDFTGLGELAGREVYEAAYRVDLLSGPVLVNWGIVGERADTVLLDPFERIVLEKLVHDHGVNRFPFEGGSWLHHYTGIYLVGDPGISCILTITIQTAYALYKYGHEEIRDLYRNLAGLAEPLMWGATWFTEVQGGSDLGANATRATPLGRGVWLLYGYKYFASGAGVADIALATARPPNAPRGAKGLGLFAVPRLRRDGKLNFHVRRLKWKSGTVAVPTGEVEFTGSEAYQVGEVEKGIYYTLEDLMVSRLANSIGALGIARKAYLEAYGYASIRRAFGRLLKEHPLALADLAEMELEIEAMTALTMYTIRLFDHAWHSRPPYNEAYHYTRLMTHVVKNMTAETAAHVTQKAMEMLGGIGFLHEYPVERWHREALITPIWEGTSNIQALDMLEAINRKKADAPLLEAMEELASTAPEPGLAEKAFDNLAKAVAEARSPTAAYYAKDILRRIGVNAAVLVLLEAARSTGDTMLVEAAKLYYEYATSGRIPVDQYEDVVREITSLRGSLEEIDWETRARRLAPGVPSETELGE